MMATVSLILAATLIVVLLFAVAGYMSNRLANWDFLGWYCADELFKGLCELLFLVLSALLNND